MDIPKVLSLSVVGFLLQFLGGTLAIEQAKGLAAGCPAHLSDVRDGHTDVHNNVCYLFVDDELYWSRARDECFKLGGDMLSIENQETMDYIAEKLDSAHLNWDRNGVWLGAYYSGDRWRWTNGHKLTYTNWDDEPGGLFGFIAVEDCGLMRKKDNWRWSDSLCGSLKFHYNFICQFPLNKPSDTEGQVAPSATQEKEDNGHTSILLIIVSLGMSLLLLMLIIAAVLFVYHRHTKRRQAAEIPVHYSNSNHYNPQIDNMSTPANTNTTTTVINISGGASISNGNGSNQPLLSESPNARYPVLPSDRPPQPPTSSDLARNGTARPDYYTEVNKPRGSFDTSVKTCQSPRMQSASPTSTISHTATSSPIRSASSVTPSSPSSSRDINLDPERAPLMTPSMSSDPLSGAEAATGLPESQYCGAMQPLSSDYVDMSSLVSKENKQVKGQTVSAPGKGNGEPLDEDKHTYSNVDNKEEKAENLYEVLP